MLIIYLPSSVPFSHCISTHKAGVTWATIRDSITHPLWHFLCGFLLFFSWLHVLMSINPVRVSAAPCVSGSDVTKAPSHTVLAMNSSPGLPGYSQPTVEISFLMCVDGHMLVCARIKLSPRGQLSGILWNWCRAARNRWQKWLLASANPNGKIKVKDMRSWARQCLCCRAFFFSLCCCVYKV